MTLVVAVGAFAAFALPSFANLSGSTFEGNDGNLVVTTTGNKDWENAPNRQVGLDLPTGQNDDSFGQGTKEDTPVPTVVTGSIPNNKSDLTRFYVANERASNKEFLYLAWERVQEPNGTTNMDFEFDQSATLSSNGKTPVRTAGDLLIKYDLSKGGAVPVLGYHLWVTSGNPATVCEASNTVPCWGKVQSLSGNFEGAINTVIVSDPVPPNAPRNLSVRTFGEAAINLTDSGILPPGTCKGFGRGYLKSRSSDSFTSEVKDFIAPIPVSISNCGQIIIHKVTVPNPDPTDTTFNYTTTGGLDPSTFGLKNGGTQDYGDEVTAGSYSVSESDPGPNFAFTSLDCSASVLTHGSTVTVNGATVSTDLKAEDKVECTYTNTLQQGAIAITKTSTKGNTALAGATFEIKDSNGNVVGTPSSGSDGIACTDHLQFGAYSVRETAAPSGYKIDDTTAHAVNVGTSATCGSGNEATVSFSDTPLSTITVSFESLADGNPTSATIQCTGDSSAQDLPEGSPRTLGDGSTTLTPGTYSCTVVIDP